MKNWFSSLLSRHRSIRTIGTLITSALITSQWAAPSPAQINPEFAQQLLTSQLNQRCNRATEVSYRSNQMVTTAGEGGTRVYVEVVLRKLVNANSPMRRSDTPGNCIADARQTSAHELVIEGPSETRRVTLAPYLDSYLIYHLQSFSANGQYLVADLQTVYPGGDGGNYIAILDLSNDGVTVSTPRVCEELDFASYYGFASATEAVVLCQGYLGSAIRLEAVNVETGAVRRLSAEPQVANYGVPAGAPEVTKIQVFE